jgi:hypothetical protein
VRDRSPAHRAALVVAGVRAHQQDGLIVGRCAGRAVQGEIEKLGGMVDRTPAHRFASLAGVGQGPPPPALRPPLVGPPAVPADRDRADAGRFGATHQRAPDRRVER